jgi:hypothetical protein
MTCYGTKLRNQNLYKTAVSYKHLYRIWARCLAVCLQTEGGGGEVALFIALPFHNTRISVNSLMSIFSRASPAFGRRSCALEENKQVTSRSTTYVLIKCLWKNITCVATDDTPFLHHVSYEKTGCVLLNYLCFAGNWNPARTECGFRLIHFLVIWTR